MLATPNLRERQATQGYIELYPKKKRFYVNLQEGNTGDKSAPVHSSAVAGTARWEVLGVPAV